MLRSICKQTADLKIVLIFLCRILDWVISVVPPTIPTRTCVVTPIPTHLLRQSRNLLLAQLVNCQLLMSVSWSWYWSASCFSNKTIPAYNQLGSTSATSFNQSKTEPPSSSGCTQLSSYHNNSWLKSLSLSLSVSVISWISCWQQLKVLAILTVSYS